MTKRFIAFVAFVLVSVLLFSACGAGDVTETTTAETTPAATTPAATTPEETTPEETTPAETLPEPVPLEPACTHSFTSRIVLTQVTTQTDGEIANVCGKCGGWQNEILPAVKSLKLLAIGNSFSNNALEYLPILAKELGIEEIIVGKLYVGGCTVDGHWSRAQSGADYESFQVNTTGDANWTTYPAGQRSLQFALELYDWDIITMQQGSPVSGVPESLGNLQNLIDFVNANKTNPDAKFIWNMTWAFQHDNDRKIFTDTFKGDQILMHEAIIDAMQEKILTRPEFSILLPTGAAVQNARSSYFGDRLTKDTLHLNNLGRVVAGYAVLASLLDKNLTEVNVGSVSSYDLTTPIRISETDRKVIIEAVNAARANPFGLIQSKYTPEYLNAIGPAAKEMSFTGTADTTAYCPYCEEDVVWKAFTSSTNRVLAVTDGNWGHYYLAEDITYSDKYMAVNDVDNEGHRGFCLHLNGHTIKNTGKRAFWIGAGNTLNIMGDGTVRGVGEGSKESEWRGTSVDTTGHVNLFGGTFTHDAARPIVMARSNSARVNVFEGATIQGNDSYSASAVFMRSAGAEFNMFGGTVEGGKAANGASIHMTAKAFINIFGGTVQGGYATSIGGNIYATNGTVNMYGGTVCGGYTTNSSSSYGRGGNVALNGSSSNKPVFNMYGGLIGSETVTGEAAGYASAGGANLYVANGTANIMGDNAVISGGYGKSYGGNVMVSSNAYVNLMKGTVKNGSSNLGGNVYLAGTSSNFTQTGGVIENGTATDTGGNTFVNNGYFTMNGGSSIGGTAGAGGSNLHLKTGKTTAANNALIHFDSAVASSAPVISGGEVLCAYNLQLGSFTSDATFVMNSTTVISTIGDITINKSQLNEVTMDLAGHNAVISGTGTLTCYDSANEDLQTFGTLTLTGLSLKNAGYNSVNNKNYYALQEGNVYSFHLLDWGLTGAALRPSTAGIYFTGTWTCDAYLASRMDSFGVAVSLHNMPGADFRTDAEGDNMWSAFTADQFESGKSFNGIMIDGILKQTDESRIAMNPIYGKMPISAVAYVTIGGETLVSEGVAMSLQDILSAISEVPEYTDTLTTFLAAWQPYGLTGKDWEF